MSKSCFVVMAIGSQKSGEDELTADDLKEKYETLIKKAVQDAYSGIEIVRVDEVSDQGTITTDIITKLLFSDFVIVDISHPNPNVYYELGIRHCSRTGTILIKDKNIGANAPFDISHERYIEYDNSPKGLADLTKQLREKFKWFEENPFQPDNHVLIHAKNSKFNFPQYGAENELMKKQEEGLNLIISSIIESEPVFNSLMDALAAKAGNNDPSVLAILSAAKMDKKVVHNLILGFMKMSNVEPQNLVEKLFKSN